MNLEGLRIALLGKTGSGKSATGNTILGRNVFRSGRSVDSVTKQTQRVEAEIGEKLICVVDTPGLFDTKVPQDKVALELGRSVYLSQPGVHAFILVFKYDRFTEQEEEMIKRTQKVFGKNVINHMIILFTHAEGVRKEEIDESPNEDLRRVLDLCGGRFHIFNNAESQNRRQVTELLQKIDRMMVHNERRFYTNELYEEAQHLTWEEFWEKHKSKLYNAAGFLAVVRAVAPSTSTVGMVIGLVSGWVMAFFRR